MRVESRPEVKQNKKFLSNQNWMAESVPKETRFRTASDTERLTKRGF